MDNLEQQGPSDPHFVPPTSATGPATPAPSASHPPHSFRPPASSQQPSQQARSHEQTRPPEQARSHQQDQGSPGWGARPDPGLNTPPFGAPRGGGYGPAAPAGSFPAPPNVPPVSAYAPPKPSTRPRAVTLLVAATISALVGAGAGIGSFAAASAGGGLAQSPIGISTLPAADSPKLDGTITAAAEKISQSVVTINVQSGRGAVGGTGVVLDAEGHILTNDHVVADAGQGSRIQVTLPDGRVVDATVVGTSPNNDLAVIKVSGVDGLVPATFATSASIDVGQTVVAVGAPLGLSESVTSGIISNTARPVRSGNGGEAVYLGVQTDAAINHGNSGGPLVDLNGAVVGINSAIAGTGSDDSESGNIGIGFAIPVDVATRVAAELIKDGRSVDAGLGVTVAGAGTQQEDPTGVALQSVTDGSAADRAGLQAGDRVTKINDYRTTSADGLIAAIRFHAPGTEVEVTYERDGETHTATVTLDAAQS